MPKTFKKEFIANGAVAHVIKRPSGKHTFIYEIRYRRNGYNISASAKRFRSRSLSARCAPSNSR